MRLISYIFLSLQFSLALQASDILIVSHYSGLAEYLEHTIPNHQNYAQHNGYGYIFREGILSDRFRNEGHKNNALATGAYWQKIVALREALDEINPATGNPYEWVMWVDADVVFSNIDRKLETVINEYAKPNTNLLIAPDHFMLDMFGAFGLCAVNTGVFILRNSLWSREFLSAVEESFEKYKNTNLPDQTAIGEILGGFDNSKKLTRLEKVALVKQNPNVVVVPQRALNPMWVGSFTTPTESVWQGGDLAVHFLGPKAFKSAIPTFLDCLKNDLSGKNCEWSKLGGLYYELKAAWEMIFGERSY